MSFEIVKYRAIERMRINLDSKLIPLVGINECGKTTILQAIYSFDYLNDSEYEGKHISSIRNLYETSEHDSIVSAKIKLKNRDLIDALIEVDEKMKEKGFKIVLSEDEVLPDISDYVKRITGLDKETAIEIYRNISKKQYSSEWNAEGVLNNSTIMNLFCETIVSKLPYILYNDDFADRPPSELIIPPSKPKVISGWLAIYERLFKMTDKNYSLFELILEEDQRRLDSILSDVKAKLNSTLSTAWKQFASEKSSPVEIDLKLNIGTENVLKISIVEKMDSRDRYFNVLDRSKGFVWHFNFIMKTQFNPKVMGKIEDTIFLLDEPGSYLHSSAQEKLCNKLAEISSSFGIVIYCTHSHHLLNPAIIPLKNVLIVEKSKKKNISAVPLPEYKTKYEKTLAMQPIFEALNVPIFEVFSDDCMLILVEGINDKYAIEMFLNIPDNIRILPGTSADSAIKNIPYMIAYDKKFKVLWDNDEEGQLSKKRANKLFHLNDDVLKMLPLQGKTKRRMEHMLSENDFKQLCLFSGLKEDASYDVLIPSLYFMGKKKKSKILDCLETSSLEGFRILEKILF
jgi:predicted ATP-dependent endonuclease of OLD family